ncbi:thrombospondin type-1 domain-containing protein 4-like isoform X2 [Pararge aegeria]|uniref:thrombospondin type-1 domain-containing protein 4-like isoform X2 n=1 Tax=Pararge aegeria TaxID=116150 RepID=UPI0019D171CE|nr:thrombospondin type-1 domain-containing protein 4-like isoform X2 [Pararge aegeria]
MEYQRRLSLYILIFIAVCLKSLIYAQTSTEVGLQQPHTTQASRTNATTYAWSSWGVWSACSRTCGGGVAVQERHCLPRDPTRWRRSRKRRKLGRSADRIRRARNAGVVNAPDCAGLTRRYHECNTAPCPGPVRDPRAEQCAVYDRRPFRGRFYTWAPYVDGNAPCVLNCRPRGQQFYASLALVTDGTPCTKPGFRAICVQGSCKVVGREDVLASTATRDVHCGRRLVSGLFSRPRLPLGYSYVTTVPRGACRLNVSEIVSSENYIALRVSNGSYIVNGEFAVSAPGTYEAAGARFIYSRSASLDNIFAMGPIHHPIDIMVLYTQPSPNIKYEYLTDSSPDETSNDIPTASSIPTHHQMQRHHRHHNAESHTRALEKPGPSLTNTAESNSIEKQYQSNVIGDRKFMWKILSYTQCSRTCGGGLQIGKFKCVEISDKEDREISPAHCTGAPPSSRRRRCGVTPCPPRWRAAAWGPCPVCGPAHRTRNVGCVQDHARGITKISDQKCPLPMPPSKEVCDVPNCDGTPNSGNLPRLDARRQVRPNDHVDTFREGPVLSLLSNVSDSDISSIQDNKFSFSSAGGWLYTEWSECVGWCVGGGVQSRSVRCADPNGCGANRAPHSSQTCSPRKQCEAQWFTGDWSPCTTACGGRQIRGVICIGNNGRRLRDASCRKPKPETERSCGGTCAPSWYLSDWGECTGPCEAAIQTRTVWCARGGAEGASGAARDADCAGLRPPAKRSCVPPRCSTRPVVKPAIISAVPSDPQQRVTRHQSQTQNVKQRTFTSNGACMDKLSNCALAVQARLCHYHYYGDNCCHSCHGR